MVGRETPKRFTNCASLGSRPVWRYFPAMISVASWRETVRCLGELFTAKVVSYMLAVAMTSLFKDVNSRIAFAQDCFKFMADT